ncbi:MAG: permease [Syntrophomonadaceae bacterium]
MFTTVLYMLAFTFLAFSYLRDKEKTKMALAKAWRAFENILPQFLFILVIIGIMLAVLDEQTISNLIGTQSGWIGMIIAGIIGSVTLIPAFVAFPLAAALYHNGAGLMQIVVFISTLTMVGIVTIPLEISYLGKKATIIRNSLAFFFSFGVALLMGGILL